MGKSSSSSSTSTPVTNQENALQTGAGAGVAVGAGASTGSINITTTSGDVATSQAAINAAAAAVASVVGLASDESHTEAGVIEHEGDTVGTVSNNAINSNTLLAGSVVNAGTNLGLAGINLGTNALAVGQNLGMAALQYSQNETDLNLNALNTNTALAFSTIDHLISGQTAGQLEAAAQALTNAATPSTQVQPTIIYAGSTQQPLTSGTGTNGSKMSTGAWIAVAAAAAIGIYAITLK